MNKELEKSIKHVFDRAKEMGDMYESETPHIAKKLNEDIEVVKELLKRNEPMKVIFTRIGNTETEISWDEPTCPKCKSLVGGSDKFCGECGQKLDWSDDE